MVSSCCGKKAPYVPQLPYTRTISVSSSALPTQVVWERGGDTSSKERRYCMCAQGAPLSGWTLNMIAIFSIIGSMPVNDSNLLYRVSFVLITLMWKGGTLECRLLLILICDPWYVVSYTLYSAPTACETCLTSKWLKPTGLAYYTLMVALYHN